MADKETPRPQQQRGMMGGHGPGNHGGLVEKPKNFWGTTRRIMSYMSDRLVGLCFVLAFASLVLSSRSEPRKF